MAGKSKQTAPFLLFWVGVLTGAFVVTMIFLFKMYDPQMDEASTSLFRYRTAPAYTQQLSTRVKFPTTNLFPQPGGW